MPFAELLRVSISIHAPLAGSDGIRLSVRPRTDFISIHAPLAGSDDGDGAHMKVHVISIHAPLAGSDSIRAILRF